MEQRVLSTEIRSGVVRLLERARNGDRSAYPELLDAYRCRLRRMIAARLDNRLARRVDPSDVVQDALIVAMRRLPKYVAEQPLSFYPWLRRIALNCLIDGFRRHFLAKNRSVLKEQSDAGSCGNVLYRPAASMCSDREPTPSERFECDEVRAQVTSRMRELPDSLREVLVLRHLEGLSVEQISQRLAIREGTVKSRHFRALAELRSLMKEVV